MHEHRSFDERAATWDDDPGKVKRAETVAAAICAAVTPTRTTRVLEYGAGTGLVTQALLPDLGPVTLADTSQGMRDVMAAKIAAGALPPSARVWDVDLATDPPPADERFDLVVTVLTLHHVDDTGAALRAFHGLLDDDGTLCVVDLDHEDGSFHGEGFHGHHGFRREDLANALATAGFTRVHIDDCGDIERDDGRYSMFLAVARP